MYHRDTEFTKDLSPLFLEAVLRALGGEILLISIRVYSRPFVVGILGLASFVLTAARDQQTVYGYPSFSLCLTTLPEFAAVLRWRCSSKHRMPTVEGCWLEFGPICGKERTGRSISPSRAAVMNRHPGSTIGGETGLSLELRIS
jgi:hypothetical protein